MHLNPFRLLQNQVHAISTWVTHVVLFCLDMQIASGSLHFADISLLETPPTLSCEDGNCKHGKFDLIRNGPRDNVYTLDVEICATIMC